MRAHTRIVKRCCKWVSGSFHQFTILSVLALALSACNGGLIGTSSGPAGTDVVVLPNKVAPQIPGSLVSKSIIDTYSQDSFIQSQSVESAASLENVSKSWQTLSPIFSKAEVITIALELELILLHAVLDSMLDRCGTLETEACVFNDGELEVVFTQALYDQYINGQTSSDEINQHSSVLDLMSHQGITIDDSISLGRIALSRVEDDIYVYRIHIEALSFLPTETVQLDWAADFSDVRYKTQSIDSEHVEYYHFQTVPDAQKLTIDAVLLDSLYNERASLELASGGVAGLDRFLINANVDGNTIAGQAIDSAAYTLLFDYGDSDNEALYLQEKFGDNGEISDFASCHFDSLEADCLMSNLIDSSVSFSGDDFENVFADLGFSDVSVQNLPDDVGHFEIRSSFERTADGSPVVYCDVWQPPEVLYETVICYDDPSITLEGVVVAIDSDGQEFVVDDAEIQLKSNARNLTEAELNASRFRGEKYVGTYRDVCTLDDFDPLNSEYVVTSITFTQETLTIKDEIFEDASCSVPASPGVAITTADLYYPEGVQQTPLGDAEFINIGLTGYTVDGMPLPSEELQLLSAAGFFDLVIYSIILIDGNSLYVGDTVDDELGLSADHRATTLDPRSVMRQ